MEAIITNIQNALISRILGVFSSGFFAWNKYNVIVESFLRCFRQFNFLTKSYDFSKAIAFAWRLFLPIFKLVSFLEYEVFFKRFLRRISIMCLETRF